MINSKKYFDENQQNFERFLRKCAILFQIEFYIYKKNLIRVIYAQNFLFDRFVKKMIYSIQWLKLFLSDVFKNFSKRHTIDSSANYKRSWFNQEIKAKSRSIDQWINHDIHFVWEKSFENFNENSTTLQFVSCDAWFF